MNKISVFLIIFFLVSCKSDNKEKDSVKDQNNSTETYKVIEELILPNVESWSTKGLEFTKEDELWNGNEVFKVTPEDPPSFKYGQIGLNNVKLGFTGGTYKINFIAKPITPKTNLRVSNSRSLPNQV